MAGDPTAMEANRKSSKLLMKPVRLAFAKLMNVLLETCIVVSRDLVIH